MPGGPVGGTNTSAYPIDDSMGRKIAEGLHFHAKF